MSLLLDIADEVVTEVNAHTWATQPEAFVAARRYRPFIDADTLNTVMVSIMLREWSASLSTRSASTSRRDITIQIVVQRKYDSEENVSCDPIVKLAEEMAERFEKWKSPGGRICVGVELAPIYAPDHIREHGIVTSVVNLLFLTHA